MKEFERKAKEYAEEHWITALVDKKDFLMAKLKQCAEESYLAGARETLEMLKQINSEEKAK